MENIRLIHGESMDIRIGLLIVSIYSINRVAIHWGLFVEFSYNSYLISILRLIACVTIGLLTSGCYNKRGTMYLFVQVY